ncbi:hypothetical protein DEJ49_33415 [Streptomyces venezuelae]|uniref:Uncharacterized protein n=1 Tax=Streptomyces venezuelae TaxID=54571 RepID=A0A5P2CSG5_STRVZ|nr:hypothetical protein [Streptomyces venezuelae]QES45240.1 hypothetical protein DEJ49_33415 [Streptomyces venezuelae]
MTQQWIRMDQSWLDDLEARLEERRQAIYRAGLQSPAYPPFPECPECRMTPEAIVQDRESPEAFPADGVLVMFRPCRHVFGVFPPTYDEAGEGA